MDKAFEMYVWGCVLREAYYFFLWFFNRQAKKENDIRRFFKKYAKVSFTFMYIVSLSAFRLERRSFDFSKFIFTCKYVKLYKLYFYLINVKLFSPENNWNYENGRKWAKTAISEWMKWVIRPWSCWRHSPKILWLIVLNHGVWTNWLQPDVKAYNLYLSKVSFVFSLPWGPF